ncbi:MAG TPA: TIGR00374 family protein, partial [Solirubrobacteraceae bacterium]
MSSGQVTVIEYLEPVVEAEALPEEFSPSSLRRSLLILGAIVLGVVALIVLVPGLGSLRERFMGAQPEWIAVAALLQLGSCAGYVLVFRGVFCRRMSWRTSTEIGLSELAANSVLSVGGAGGLALGAWILRRGGLSTAFIARRTVAFFLLTSLANVGFLAIGGIGLATGLLHGSPSIVLGLVPAIAAVAA